MANPVRYPGSVAAAATKVMQQRQNATIEDKYRSIPQENAPAPYTIEPSACSYTNLFPVWKTNFIVFMRLKNVATNLDVVGYVMPAGRAGGSAACNVILGLYEWAHDGESPGNVRLVLMPNSTSSFAIVEGDFVNSTAPLGTKIVLDPLKAYYVGAVQDNATINNRFDASYDNAGAFGPGIASRLCLMTSTGSFNGAMPQSVELLSAAGNIGSGLLSPQPFSPLVWMRPRTQSVLLPS